LQYTDLGRDCIPAQSRTAGRSLAPPRADPTHLQNLPQPAQRSGDQHPPQERPQQSSGEAEGGERVAYALFRLWRGRFDSPAKSFQRGSLVFTDARQILVDVLGFTICVTLFRPLL
jgi:hypothetical protein